MDKIIIEPKIGIGTIKLGMSKAEVEDCLQDYSNKFHKSYHDNEFFHYAFRIEYDSNARVNFIEIASHLKEEFNCLFDGTDVFNTKAENLVKMVNEKSPYDENDPELGWMYSFPELGLNFWRSRIFKEEDKLEDWFIELSQEDQEEECRFQYFETVSIFSN